MTEQPLLPSPAACLTQHLLVKECLGCQKKAPSLRTLLNRNVVKLSCYTHAQQAEASGTWDPAAFQGQPKGIHFPAWLEHHKKWCCKTTKSVLWSSPPQNTSISFRSKDEHLDKIPWGIILGEFCVLQAPSNTSKNGASLLGGGNMTIKSLRSEKISKIIKPRRLTSQGNHK